MTFREIASFDVAHGKLAWPWISFSPGHMQVAFATSDRTIETRALDGDELRDGTSFSLPPGLELPRSGASASERGALDADLHGFTVDAAGRTLAVVGMAHGSSVLVTCTAAGEAKRSGIEALVGHGFGAQAVSFDASGERLWISLDGETESALLLVEAGSHAVLGVSRFPAFSPPATHELHVHPGEDAVLLLAACDGTFGRVARYVGGVFAAIPTAIDEGCEAMGLLGFSTDGTRVFLAGEDVLRVRAWPSLSEIASRELEDDFVSAYSGVVVGERVYVDGENVDEGAEAVLSFDAVSLKGERVETALPGLMWAGRLGADMLVTVEPKSDPARARVYSVGR